MRTILRRIFYILWFCAVALLIIGSAYRIATDAAKQRALLVDNQMRLYWS